MQPQTSSDSAHRAKWLKVYFAFSLGPTRLGWAFWTCVKAVDSERQLALYAN